MIRCQICRYGGQSDCMQSVKQAGCRRIGRHSGGLGCWQVRGLARLSLFGGFAVAEGRDFAFLCGDEDAVAIGYGALLDSAMDLRLTGY